MEPGPVTADDLADVAAASDAAPRAAPADADWWQPAHGLSWTCWETVEHLADDYFYYAVELGRPGGPGTNYLPIEDTARGEGGPRNTVRVDPEAGPDGLLDVLASCGALLVASVRAAPPGARPAHPRPHGRPRPDAGGRRGVPGGAPPRALRLGGRVHRPVGQPVGPDAARAVTTARRSTAGPR